MKIKLTVVFVLCISCVSINAQQTNFISLQNYPDNIIGNYYSHQKISEQFNFAGSSSWNMFSSRSAKIYPFILQQDIILIGENLSPLRIHFANQNISSELLNKNILFSTEDESESNDSDESFFSNNFLYFVGAAALAVTFYLVWERSDNKPQNKTFGYPGKPN